MKIVKIVFDVNMYKRKKNTEVTRDSERGHSRERKSFGCSCIFKLVKALADF